MNVHVIRSAYFPEEDYKFVLQLLKSNPGPLSFNDASKKALKKMWEQESFILAPSSKDVLSPDSQFELDEITTYMEWEDFFNLCDIYRKEHNLKNEDFVVLLTPHYNTNNWFASYADDANNIFAHTGDWEYYLPHTPAIYPITYLVVSQVIQKSVYQTVEEKLTHAHADALGCMSDFCGTKSEISLKLRTADICPECLDHFDKIGNYDTLINQAFTLFEEIRRKVLYKQHHKPRPSRLHITSGNEIVLVDYQNASIELTPLEKTVFLFYLKYSEGIENMDLPKYRAEIESIYEHLNIIIPTVRDEDIAAIEEKLKGSDLKTIKAAKEELFYKAEEKAKEKFDDSVNALVNRKNNSMSEKRATIKRKFTEAFGEDVANHYIVIGAKGEPFKIDLDRSLVTCDSDIYGTRIFPAKSRERCEVVA